MSHLMYKMLTVLKMLNITVYNIKLFQNGSIDSYEILYTYSVGLESDIIIFSLFPKTQMYVQNHVY